MAWDQTLTQIRTLASKLIPLPFPPITLKQMNAETWFPVWGFYFKAEPADSIVKMLSDWHSTKSMEVAAAEVCEQD